VENTSRSRRGTPSCGMLKAGDWCHRFGETFGEQLSGGSRLCLNGEDESLGRDSCAWFSSTACERGNGKGEGREAENHRLSFRGIPGGFVSRV
jgi:hypothetical protein